MCGYSCIRYLVFFFNVIFFITGFGLIGSGAYLRVEKDDYLDLCDKYSFVTGANILIAVGVIVVIVAFFGCFGAFKENTCMLGIFFFLLFVIFILELAAGIYSAVKRNKSGCDYSLASVGSSHGPCPLAGYSHQQKRDSNRVVEVTDEVESCLNDTLKKYNEDEGIKKLWNEFQEKFDCCGVKNSGDYPSGQIPASCNGHKDVGCKEKFEDDLKSNLGVVIGVGIGFAMIQVLGMIMSMWLICQIKSKGEVV